jgi:hypothetical protein
MPKITGLLNSMKDKYDWKQYLATLKTYSLEQGYPIYPVLITTSPRFSGQVRKYIHEKSAMDLPMPYINAGTETEHIKLEHLLYLTGVLGHVSNPPTIIELGYFSPGTKYPDEFIDSFSQAAESIAQNQVQIPAEIEQVVMWYSVPFGNGRLEFSDIDIVNTLVSQNRLIPFFYAAHERITDTMRWYELLYFGADDIRIK